MAGATPPDVKYACYQVNLLSITCLANFADKKKRARKPSPDLLLPIVDYNKKYTNDNPDTSN